MKLEFGVKGCSIGRQLILVPVLSATKALVPKIAILDRLPDFAEGEAQGDGLTHETCSTGCTDLY